MITWKDISALNPFLRSFLCKLFIFCVAWNSSCSIGAQESIQGKYRVVDSGYFGRVQAAQDVYWIDNEQVLFLGGGPRDQKAPGTQQGNAREGLYIWNAESGAINAVDERLTTLQSVCFRSAFTWKSPPKDDGPIVQGYVRYVYKHETTFYVGFGMLFRARERELDVQAIRDGISDVSPVSCKEFNPKQLKKRYGENPLPLLEPGEYLDRTSQDPARAQPLRYFPESGGAAVALTKIPPTAVLATPRYSEYSKKYVFKELRSDMGPNSPMKMWMLDRSGGIQEFVLPTGPWMSGSPDAMPSRNGWFVTSTAVAVASPGHAGGYVASKGSVTRAVVGWPRSFAISPSGCRVAISISDHERKEVSAPKIKMIDLCSKEN